MAAGVQVGVASFRCDVIGGEVADPLGVEAEQQDEGAGCPDVGRAGSRRSGMLQQLPAFVIAEQVRWLLARDGRDGELAGETAVSGPVQEVADTVAALGAFLVEPAVDVVLAQLSRVIACSSAQASSPGRPGSGGAGRGRRDRVAASRTRGCGLAAAGASAGTGGRGWRARLACRPGGARARTGTRSRSSSRPGSTPVCTMTCPDVVRPAVGGSSSRRSWLSGRSSATRWASSLAAGLLADPLDRSNGGLSLGECLGQRLQLG